MSFQNNYEDGLPLKTSLAATDGIRTIVGGISSQMRPSALAGQLEAYLTNSGTAKLRSITSSGSILSTDAVVLVTNGATVSLPNPSVAYDSTNSRTNIIYVLNADTSGTVTVNPYNSEDIYSSGAAQTSLSLAAGAGSILATNGTSWYELMG
jgi:tRNA-binding EMAP/Myf-like protein